MNRRGATWSGAIFACALVVSCAGGQRTAPASPAEEEAPAPGAQPDSAAPRPQPAQAAPSEEAPLEEEAGEEADLSGPPAAAAPAPASEAKRAQSGATPQMQLERAWHDLQHDHAQLSQALALKAPNCSQANQFRRRVCDLAERICKLEEKIVDSTRPRCDDARRRCKAASREYKRRCS